MAGGASTGELVQVVALLGAGVVAVPIFRRLGLGSVLGYLAAGLAIGPFGLGLFTDAGAILHVAELGVVMFLFIIGLEMQPSRLWNLRAEIFGLGAAQVAVCGALLTGLGILAGFSWQVAFVAGMGFVLSSTAIVMQILTERGEASTPAGQRVISILLLEDLAIVPLLALVALLAPSAETVSAAERWIELGIAAAAVAGLVIAGRFLLNPLFRLLAAAGAREVMTAAALLVVLGSALAMQLGGLSAAMGAFLAGVLLSESTFRHQLEADVEPFRGILLGLFFLGVGMSLDLAVIARAWAEILALVAGYMVLKGLGIYVVARLICARHDEAITRTALLAQGGEFAFVLYAAAAGVGLLDAELHARLTATVIISMALTPFAVMGLRFVTSRAGQSMDGVDVAHDLHSSLLLIGYGRFGQIASQPLLARGIDISIIDHDTDMIRAAATFGSKVYFGDGARLDILHAAGAHHARAILVCVDDKVAATRIVELCKAEYPLTPVFARAFDRGHAIELVHAGADLQMRETFESALLFGAKVLETLGTAREDVAEVVADVRRRDAERLDMQLGGGIYAGRDLLLGNLPKVPTGLMPREPERSPVATPGDP
ncbi:monovalent cation:proton antiporter-2 (CPA2) family protein [Methylobrevis albus]|uniref:Cation:proton antiporter n=1 Tax=Methylobrevis albus TaxID=2793297 RepID=A0A931HYL9_9HYPH|nr:monovalent cation:proton antiporter-2 (CPA2) family protein [Methylobrevis albus]MBH0236292.1 cation:proton antiporter [Methylobrevis albus]